MILFKKILKWAGVVIVGALILLVIVRAFHFYNLDKTNAVVEKIHATKLTLSDVLGENLPPDPGAEADKTIAGIDANNNGIRDDVEIAIFKAYPNSAKKRAVALQYAMALQNQTIQPTLNKDIVIATIQEEDRAGSCVGDIFYRNDDNEQVMKKYFKDSDGLRSFIKNQQLNTLERKKYRTSFYEYLDSYSSLDHYCDIDYSTLPN